MPDLDAVSRKVRVSESAVPPALVRDTETVVAASSALSASVTVKINGKPIRNLFESTFGCEIVTTPMRCVSIIRNWGRSPCIGSKKVSVMGKLSRPFWNGRYSALAEADVLVVSWPVKIPVFTPVSVMLMFLVLGDVPDTEAVTSCGMAKYI